ncbi:hypothetical protein ACFWBV_03390 [Streptomyces sp. NPDC060030]|uniref:hypothetical protein n=1 Tax=Streptomyces sp. NPDC060030 TaxID=3347042 RepID=UPI0036831C17
MTSPLIPRAGSPWRHVPAEVGSGDETPVFRVWSVDDVDANNTADTPFTYTE